MTRCTSQFITKSFHICFFNFQRFGRENERENDMLLRTLVFAVCLAPLVADAKDLEFDVQKDLVYSKVGDHELLLDAYIPKKDGSYPAVLVVHGGAWRSFLQNILLLLV